MVFCADKADIQRLSEHFVAYMQPADFYDRASTTALFYCTLKMAEDRDEGLTRMFFRAFRSNFKPATKLWLILLALGCFLGVDASC